MITQEQLKELLHYDPDTGVFTWKVRIAGNANIGDVAGYLNGNGYSAIKIHGKECKSHRLAWLYVYGELPPDQIDHINHIKGANWIANLRCVTGKENAKNLPMRKDNTSGVSGISWHKHKCKWCANIRVECKRISLGHYSDINAAIMTRYLAARAYGFHENHGKDIVSDA